MRGWGRLRRLLFGGRDSVDEADRLIAQGNQSETQGRMEEACVAYRMAIALAPRYAKAHLNLGIALQAAGDNDAALSSYETALRHDASNPIVQYNLANLLTARGDLARAKQLLRLALDRRPDFTEARIVLAHVHDLQGNLVEAANELERTVRHASGHAGAWHNYAVQLAKLERRDDAEKAVRRACEIEPTALPALLVLGNLLRIQARHDEAAQVFAAARRVAPERFDFESRELHALNLSDSTTAEALAVRHRAFGARLEAAVPVRFTAFGNTPDPERRLRVGYVSSDFNLHPVAWFAIPVLERHDRSAFDIYGYSTNSISDDVTRQVRERTDHYLDAHALSDRELADRIHEDAIDILVDLTGHAGLMRLGVFAQQPAPVQVTWLGYLNTTGLTRIRYRLCDAYTDPPGLTEHLHTESLIRIPHSQWCYRPVAQFPQVADSPCLRNGFVTFGSFNNFPKLSASVRRLWIDVLTRVPEARMVIVGVPQGTARDGLLADFDAGGIDRSRLTIVSHVALGEYFSSFNAVDIALDSTPYSGGTTTCDTLWMGVPVLTVPGARSASRSAASILTGVGMESWIAANPEDYVRLAQRYGRDHGLLAELRKTLRQRIERSPLMDERGFTRNLEGTYRTLWRRWCCGEVP